MRRGVLATILRLPDRFDPRNSVRLRYEHAPVTGRPGPVRCRSPADDVRGLLLDGMSLVVGLRLGRDRRPSAAAPDERQTDQPCFEDGCGARIRPAQQDISMGSSGDLGLAASLTWGGDVSASGGGSVDSPVFPVVSRTIWHASGTTSSSRTLG